MDSRSDLRLLGDWRAGDRSAAELLTRRYYASVHRFFDLKVAHVAADLTQETFLAAVAGLDGYRDDAGFKAFLFGIARHQLLRHLRKQGRTDRAMRFAEVEAAAPHTPLSVVAARREEHRLMLMAIAQLPTDLHVVLELHYWESMSAPEIAVAVESNASTVRGRLARARELVRESIADMTQPGRLRDALLGDLERWQHEVGTLAHALSTESDDRARLAATRMR